MKNSPSVTEIVFFYIKLHAIQSKFQTHVALIHHISLPSDPMKIKINVLIIGQIIG